MEQIAYMPAYAYLQLRMTMGSNPKLPPQPPRCADVLLSRPHPKQAIYMTTLHGKGNVRVYLREILHPSLSPTEAKKIPREEWENAKTLAYELLNLTPPDALITDVPHPQQP